jgi:hypothetical protein
MTTTSTGMRIRGGLVMIGLALLSGGLTGCGGGGGGGGRCSVAPAAQASWVIADANNNVFTCAQVDAATVEFSVDGTKYNFPCGAGVGLTTALSPGSHSGQFRLLSSNGAVLSDTGAMGFTVPSCGVNDLGTITFEVAACAQGPAVQAEWSITKQVTGAPLSCDQAAAVFVDLFLNDTKYEFQCSALTGITTPIAAGTYTARLSLIGTNGTSLSDTQSMAVTVPSCGVVDLGNVPFDVN